MRRGASRTASLDSFICCHPLSAGGAVVLQLDLSLRETIRPIRRQITGTAGRRLRYLVSFLSCLCCL